MDIQHVSGALNGVRIIEFTGLGPAPYCGMMLADHGADVIRIDRVNGTVDDCDPLSRGKKSIALDLKDPNAREIVLQLIASADGIIEGFRPGVMERLGFGPDEMLALNPNLVFGRMTGWGQHGPYAHAAGHDINYIALSGALHQCGRAGMQPSPPSNFLGDFGGGGMMLAFGMVSALLAVKNGSNGQVIDCAMTDGSALLTAMAWGFRARGQLRDEAGVNLLDTGAHFYDTYETSDGKYISLGAIEPQFYKILMDTLGLQDDPDMQDRFNPETWPVLKRRIAEIIRGRTRAEWDALMAETDICYAPVLSMTEAQNHPHNRARNTFIEVDGVPQPAPAPRFTGTPAKDPETFGHIGQNTDEILRGLGKADAEIAALKDTGVVK